MNYKQYSISILLCCHNRKAATLRCLSAVYKQIDNDDLNAKVVLVDDGSMDGTSQAVIENFPKVRLIRGSGDLFWSGGMRMAYEHADPSDFFLWLNDDVIPYEGSILKMLKLAIKEKNKVVMTGAVKSSSSNKVAYGGMRRTSRRRLRFCVLEPFEKRIVCDTTNGNFVLIPSGIYKAVGNIDPYFVHAHGDIDFGLRVRKAGFEILLSHNYVGEVETRFLEQRVYRDGQGIKDRVKLITDIKALHPKEWWFLCKRHCQHELLYSFLSPYLRVARKRPLGFVKRPK